MQEIRGSIPRGPIILYWFSVLSFESIFNVNPKSFYSVLFYVLKRVFINHLNHILRDIMTKPILLPSVPRLDGYPPSRRTGWSHFFHLIDYFGFVRPSTQAHELKIQADFLIQKAKEAEEGKSTIDSERRQQASDLYIKAAKLIARSRRYYSWDVLTHSQRQVNLETLDDRVSEYLLLAIGAEAPSLLTTVDSIHTFVTRNGFDDEVSKRAWVTASEKRAEETENDPTAMCFWFLRAEDRSLHPAKDGYAKQYFARLLETFTGTDLQSLEKRRTCCAAIVAHAAPASSVELIQLIEATVAVADHHDSIKNRSDVLLLTLGSIYDACAQLSEKAVLADHAEILAAKSRKPSVKIELTAIAIHFNSELGRQTELQRCKAANDDATNQFQSMRIAFVDFSILREIGSGLITLLKSLDYAVYVISQATTDVLRAQLGTAVKNVAGVFGRETLGSGGLLCYFGGSYLGLSFVHPANMVLLTSSGDWVLGAANPQNPIFTIGIPTLPQNVSLRGVSAILTQFEGIETIHAALPKLYPSPGNPFAYFDGAIDQVIEGTRILAGMTGRTYSDDVAALYSEADSFGWEKSTIPSRIIAIRSLAPLPGIASVPMVVILGETK